MRFSERHGHREVREALQVEWMDARLRNGIWDCVFMVLKSLNERSERAVQQHIWRNFFGYPIDTVPAYSNSRMDRLRDHFFKYEWYEVYDLVEFFSEALADVPTARDKFAEYVNATLKSRGAGYRLIGDTIVPVTDENSLESIQSALTSAPSSGARSHLSKALALLGNRQDPDYANSIKESISAVESICSQIVGKENATLGEALKRLEAAGVSLHPALREGWNKLYGYTSDADGIRHASLDESSVDADDALYFLVTCSAFVNLLVSKGSDILGAQGSTT